jgi:hypothetical protein
MRAASRSLATGDGRWRPPCCCGPERRRGRCFPLGLHWAVSGLGREPEPGWLPFSPQALLRPKAAVGRSFSQAGPVEMKNWFSIFLFEKRNSWKNVCVHILAPKMVKQIYSDPYE